jgi:type VI secretion system protein VasG
MATVDLKPLVARLDPRCRRALEAAAGLTLSRSHYNVELEHWLIKLAEAPDGDLPLILGRQGADAGRLLADLNRALDRLSTGNARAPSLSPEIVSLAREAWLLASVEQGAATIRSGHLLWALLADEPLARRAREMSSELARVSAEALKRDFVALTIDVLTRRRQNNPILTGEAGVGKTAVVEGLALRIAAGDVPAALTKVTLRMLDLGLLQAGAGVKGEFENRLKSVIEEVQASPQPIILFIDEAHTLIGAGGAAGQGDAANLLKPALARGELRTIAATTWAEYKRYFEKDAALARRFQVVKVEEPTEAVAIDMIRGLVSTLEAHHKVRILDEAVVEAVRLSARYIPSRQLPDKAVSLIDTACARVGMSQTTVPAEIEDKRRRLALIATERAILAREAAEGADCTDRDAALVREHAAVEAALAALDARWAEEKRIADDIAALRTSLSADREISRGAARSRLVGLFEALHELQGESPLIHPAVDGQAIAEIVANWTGVPAGRMRSDAIHNVLSLRASLEKRVIGQPHAIDAVARAVQTAAAKLTDPRKPLAAFLMAGTSGVGKTETALALAEALYGGEQNLTTINMSEFKEEHKVSLLMGSPPGYVGYGEGGLLTEAVRRRPYSVILLDEMEKAHPGVQDVFYQVFDKGTMTDGEGREIDFRNTVIIMTSNAGTDVITRLFADSETAPDAPELGDALRPALLRHFKPAFLGRVTLVPYLPLPTDIIRRIVRMQLARVAKRFDETYKARFVFGESVVDSIAERCTETGSGARNVESILSRTLLPEVSARVLARLGDGLPITEVTVVTDAEGRFEYTIT